MSMLNLVAVNLGRKKLRTTLTMLSVFVAIFLFCSLQGILDTLESTIEVGSESRLITRNAISLVFDLPMAYQERLKAVPNVKSVSVQNWFGGQDPVNPKNFYPQFAVEAETFFPQYAADMDIIEASPAQAAVDLPPGVDPKLASFMLERNAAVVGEKLMNKMGWKIGQTFTINGTIYPGPWEFVVRAVYRPKNKSFGEETVFFHWKYLYENSNQMARAGIFSLELTDPTYAADVARQVDLLFENSSAQTKTETERAFQAGFVSMFGNLPFVLGVIGFAVVFAILFVAANTMVMTVRERAAEIGAMKTLGFEDGAIFRMVLAEAAIITVGGGAAGALFSKFLIEWSEFNAGGMLPVMTVNWSTIGAGVAIALAIGAVSGLIPAVQAARLKIVDALRRVE